ncbi:MAG: hypothetical protein KJ579_08295 [Verrucomicrobia bacterium]|nr:hypothetical protein [Verrucomicrobiota bacterium]
MKVLAWIPVALLLGLALGAWPAKHEVQQLREEAEKLRKEAKARGAGAGTLGQLTQIMRIPDASAPPKPRAPAAPPTQTVAAAEGASTNKPPRRRPPFAEMRPQPGDDRSMRERIDAGMEAWRVRSDIARNNFIANTGLDTAQAAQFDVLTQAMNLRLKDRLAKFAEEAKKGKKITPESGARIINDLSGAVVMTYDEMDRTLPEWRKDGAGRFDMADFIDPSVAEPLIDIEGEIRRAERERQP